MGVTIVVITHDRDIANHMGRRIEMLDGEIVYDSAREIGASTRPSVGGASRPEEGRR
jgi:ABC-type lipoprotein export system ATPase subunit